MKTANMIQAAMRLTGISSPYDLALLTSGEDEGEPDGVPGDELVPLEPVATMFVPLQRLSV
jgi:hypothetical protein